MVQKFVGNPSQLTRLQKEVLSRCSNGQSLDEISNDLQLSAHTLTTLMEMAMIELGANNLVQAGYLFANILDNNGD